MKKTRLAAVAAAALIVLILGILLLPGSTAENTQVEVREARVEVAAAAAEIPAYSVITAEMVTLTELPESAVRENHLLTMEEAVGKRSLADMVPGEPILSNHIMDQDDPENRLAFKDLEKGLRAMSLPVTDVTGVCSLVRVGDRVDVILVTRDWAEEKSGYGAQSEAEADTGRMAALPLLQNKEVLALDQDTLYAPKTDGGLYGYKVVTLAMTPEETLRLAWGAAEGTLILALRSEGDDALLPEDAMVKIRDYFGKEN